MDDLDTEKLQEVLSILKDCGMPVSRFKCGTLVLEFADTAPAAPVGFAKSNTEMSPASVTGYDRLFGGQKPAFPRPSNGVNE